MNLSKIHHIAIIVSNYEAAKDFYVNKLGFSVIRENYRPERKDWKLDLRVNELTELEIFAEENPPKRVNRPEACGLRHLAFCVDSVEQTVKELTEVGIESEPIRVDDYTGKKMTFFHDPDGLPLELHEKSFTHIFFLRFFLGLQLGGSCTKDLRIYIVRWQHKQLLVSFSSQYSQCNLN